MTNKTKDSSVTKQPKSLLWADARSLLIVVFVLGLAAGLIGGYFAAIEITNDMRQNFVTEQHAIAETVTKKASK